jgi:hypothetical protein
MADPSSPKTDAGRVTVPLPVWFTFFTVVGLLAGYLGQEVQSVKGVLLVILVGVVLLSYCEVRRWRRLARQDGNYNPRSLVAMVISFGVFGGAWFGVLGWLFAVLVAWVLVRLPGVAADELLRSLLGAAVGVGFFFLVVLLARKRGPPDAEGEQVGPEEGSGGVRRRP